MLWVEALPISELKHQLKDSVDLPHLTKLYYNYSKLYIT